MRTMHIKEPGQVGFIDVEKPMRKKDEILLKLLYGGICGSDLGSCRGAFAYFDYPRVPGREFSAGIVEADEDNEQSLCPGTIVTCSPCFDCEHYYSCKDRIVNACMDNQAMGCQRDGAFQEYITMSSERVCDGKGIDPMLLVVIEPFCIGYHGVSRTEVGTGEKVLVIGVGTIGVLAAVAAKAEGTFVYISDVSEGRLKMAKAFGVDDTILNGSPENFKKAINDIAEGNGFDTAVEAVGFPSIFQNCIDVAYLGGKVVVIGVGRKNLDFNFTLPQKKELNVFGSRNALKKGSVKLIDLVKGGETPIENIIINICKFENGAKAFYSFAHNLGGMLRVVIDFTGD